MLLPLYMQIVHGASPTEAGLLMLPMVVGMMTGSIGVRPGDLPHRPHPARSRSSARPSIVVGLFLLSLVRRRHRAGLGQPVDAGARPRARQLHAADPADRAERRAAQRDRRRHQLGDVLPPDRRHARRRDLPVGALRHRRRQHPDRRRGRRPDARVAAGRRRGHRRFDPSVVAQVQDDSSFIEDLLDPVLAHPFKVGFAESMDLVFLLAAGVGVLAFLILLLLPTGRAAGDLGECRGARRGLSGPDAGSLFGWTHDVSTPSSPTSSTPCRASPTATASPGSRSLISAGPGRSSSRLAAALAELRRADPE